MANIAIILFGGNSTRFKADTSKQLFEVNGHPLAYYAIKPFVISKLIDKIVIVVNESCENKIKEIAKDFDKDIFFVDGGKTRNESVFNALKSIEDTTKDNDIVLIHDGARLCLEEKQIKSLITALNEYDAATLALPMEDTIATTVSDLIKDVPNRNKYVKIQTPQAFRYSSIMYAHEYNKIADASDDTQLAINCGYDVAIIEGSKKLSKITTIEDIEMIRKYLD
ncbi:MAG: 2-C-methyl-D-erythritol 4-phosphate cytidylyltransferase [Bacteroidales bacterium]|nr:2-C-methyl-D-erythritol 4-phosphate cytidylyltransferase [Bacteroidales bacterium]